MGRVGEGELVRIIPAMSPTDTMNAAEVDRFLQDSKIPLKLGTIDQHGDPVIHPLWFDYNNGKFYLITASNSKKLQNAMNKSRVYFCVDIETRPYKGVKGKGTLAKVNDLGKAVKLGQRIITKYMGDTDNPLGKFLLNRLKEGKETLVEITPSYFSVWDDSKTP
jgi:nitroimidazol reductase NimA-like FMN-containing flavoprotein (pyridoxamine 5'-phosphate oxidase superfamily)